MTMVRTSEMRRRVAVEVRRPFEWPLFLFRRSEAVGQETTPKRLLIRINIRPAFATVAIAY